ncbi:MAG: carboxy-terminal-processing protease, carboxyl-terminal processing protease [Candidatus Parcubacteria bacterium]|jgi:carboxyl-terminal processing protease
MQMNFHGPSWKNPLITILFIAIVVGAFYGGFAAGKSSTLAANRIENIINKTDGKSENVDFGLFWKTWTLLNEKFVATHNEKPATDQDKVYGAIKGMVASLGDPYTVFFTPEEESQFESQIQGNFEGVGMEMGIKDDTLTVISALPGTPAKKAGIQSGDKLIKIDDKLSNGMTVDQAVKLIRGKKGTSVKLTMVREDKEPIEFTVVRDVINLPVIETSLDKKTNIFTIRLYSFSAQSASLFRSAMKEFSTSKSNKLIIDLRGNPGGYLDAAVDMAGWFLPPGKVVVRQASGAGKSEIALRSQGPDIFNDSVKTVILVDNGSASASEILAGALSEYGKATLVGTATFGKGSVQEYIKVTPDTALKVTIARWLTPNGVSISEGGLKPQVEVKITKEDVAAGRDPQMLKAVEILSK